LWSHSRLKCGNVKDQITLRNISGKTMVGVGICLLVQN